MNHVTESTPARPTPIWWPLLVVGSCVLGALLLIRWVVLTPVGTDSGGNAHAREEQAGYGWVFEPVPATATGELPPERWEQLVSIASDFGARGTDDARRFVVALTSALDARPLGLRTKAVSRFLESGLDADLGLGFVVGSDGFLSEAPTLRILFIDYQARHDPAAAQSTAGELLAKRPERAGEWALAFRELARDRPPGQWPALMEVRMAELVADRAWAEHATAGWVEAFDVFAASRSTGHLEALSRMASSAKTRDERFAAFLAVDRLMLLEPRAVTAELNHNDTLFAGASGVRASLFARVDPRDEHQREALEAWFHRPEILAGERGQFASLFPHHLASASRNLITVIEAPGQTEAAAWDRAALEHVRRWRTDPELATWHDTFARIEQRVGDRVGR